ncbi:flagellar hook-basal body complex protein FliE [Marisediminicola antarctica]|uniref:Flagellar hook-basal body complex protein FliE n=1 Tax=Marisediminicola antarctica TaxID=674079 RepID=A0A7L5AJZ7_9MICO|nr:flagellar hook-basal body complex protein FliE [Marisediminicola antarctica]QHO68619.1 flagellar hook-basal body complex protein FliE [Marisediminicola antarctica]
MIIPALTAVQPTNYLPSAAPAASPTGGADFGDQLGGAITNLQALQGTSGDLAVKALTGNLSDIHQATLASTRAQVTLELVAAVRNKGVDAFNEIMRMQA